MRLHPVLGRIASVSLLLVLGGCSQNMVRDVAGTGMVSFGNNYIAPWFMASDDTDIMCAMGEGMGTMAFPLGPKVDPMIPMLTLASGMCADERAKEEELRYIRAMRKNNVEEAQDARTQQKRWLELAARRQYSGYQAVVRHFGDPGSGCPMFDDRHERMSYMFGLFGGIQAVQTDMNNGGTAGVPLSVMPKSINGLACLDNDEFWGLPKAIQASVELLKANMGGDAERENYQARAAELTSRLPGRPGPGRPHRATGTGIGVCRNGQGRRHQAHHPRTHAAEKNRGRQSRAENPRRNDHARTAPDLRPAVDPAHGPAHPLRHAGHLLG